MSDRRVVKYLSFFGWISFIILTIGCSSNIQKVYIHPNTNFKYIKKVAVMPFANLTNDKFSGDRVRNMFVTELLSTRTIDIVELGELQKVLETEGIRTTDTVSTEIAQKIGNNLGVQAVILGSVDQYEMTRTGQNPYPEVCISVRMLEVETGTIIWTVTRTETGKNWFNSLVGVGSKTEISVASRVVKKIVSTLVYE
ncbi:MAG: CsgG/HfaB family protein [bacterium]